MTNFITKAAAAFFLGAASIAMPTAASAAETCPSGLDTNDDGFIDMREWGTIGTGLFNDWDDDENGFLGLDEFNDCLGDAAGSFFNDWDENDNNVLERNEFFTNEEFAEQDENNDNRLDTDEFLFDDFLV